jgi:hypothetical protein
MICFQENKEFVTEHYFFNKYFSQNDENSLLKKKMTNEVELDLIWNPTRLGFYF